jgi:hypothetical protein
MRKTLPHLIDVLCRSALMWEGCHELPPVSGIAIEQMLDLLEIGPLVRGDVCDFVLIHSYHGVDPYPGDMRAAWGSLLVRF